MAPIKQQKKTLFRSLLLCGHTIKTQASALVWQLLQLEALSGIILLLAGIMALIAANSSLYEYYNYVWHIPLPIFADNFACPLNAHFFINDVLMAIFFVVVGVEIKKELHDGALATVKQALLPLVAAVGGVLTPAIFYMLFNNHPDRIAGWAIPTATDIAFAVGILALLGQSLPKHIRTILLSLAIIDDIIAVVIIALFYSHSIALAGLLCTFGGIITVIVLQRLKLSSVWFYSVPAAIIWFGLFQAGVHPSLAGIILGLLTPSTTPQQQTAKRQTKHHQAHRPKNAPAFTTLPRLTKKQPNAHQHTAAVNRVQTALQPWVNFAIMPLFAFANAGVNFSTVDLDNNGNLLIIGAIAAGLFVGKPLGVITACYVATQCGICQLPRGITWSAMLLVGVLAGIGFTMAILVATLAFPDQGQLTAAKIGVVLGSTLSACFGLVYGAIIQHKMRQQKR